MGRATKLPVVLLVEDEALISNLIADVLNNSGFAVHELASGDAALAYLHAGGEVDVLFTDINLPGAIDGVELARQARQLRPELPIIYTSGRCAYSDLGTVVPRSVFVAKPYSPPDVCTLIGRMTAN